MVDFQERDTKRGMGDDEDEDGEGGDENEDPDETAADEQSEAVGETPDDAGAAVDEPADDGRAPEDTDRAADEPSEASSDPLGGFGTDGDDANGERDSHAEGDHGDEHRSGEHDRPDSTGSHDERGGSPGHDHDHSGETGHDHDHDHHAHDVDTLGVAVVTVSTSRSLSDDPAGDAIVTCMEDAGHEVVTRELIKDRYDNVQSTVDTLSSREDTDVVITTGGTGVTPDDVTIEATRRLFDKELPGFGELFRLLSFDEVGTRIVGTRTTAGIVDGVPVFCLPGSENAARLGTEAIIVEEAGHLAGLAER